MGNRLSRLVVLLSMLLGCSNEGAAPASYLDEPLQCPPLDSMLPITIEMAEQGELVQLRQVLSEELDAPVRQQIVHVVAGLLEIVPPSHFSDLAVVGESKVTPRVLSFLDDLLRTLGSLSPEIQNQFDEGLHRWSQSCPYEPLLRAIESGSYYTGAIIDILRLLVGGDAGVLANGSIDPQVWLDLYIGLLEIVVELPGSEEDLKALISFISVLPGLDVLEGATALFDDQIFLDSLGETARCFRDLEFAYNYGMLTGVAHISTAQNFSLADEPESVRNESSENESEASAPQLGPDPANAALRSLLAGVLASPDMQESFRYVLSWFFLPERAARIRLDLARLFGSGSVEEVLRAVSRIGLSDCEPLESSVMRAP